MRRGLTVLALVVLAAHAPAAAADGERDRAVLARVLPGADHFGMADGTPPAIEATRDGERVGYVFFTRDVVGSVGFSGKPLDVAVGLDLAGLITGAEIVEHHEPILVIGVSSDDLDGFAAQFRGIDIRATPRFEAERLLTGDGVVAIDDSLDGPS